MSDEYPSLYPQQEPTQQASVPPVYPYDYSLVPPPPPPTHSYWKRWVAGILAVLLLGNALLVGYLLGSHQGGQTSATPSAVPPTPTLRQPTPTPTLNTQAALQTSDFAKFIEAFSLAMTSKDYATVQTATDTENFESIVLFAGGNRGDWNQMSTQLETGGLSFVIPYSPPAAPSQFGYGCEGYSNQGIDALGVTIPAQALQYVVGTSTGTGYFDAPNTTVFIFELPEVPSADWLWWGVTWNNVANCNAF